MLTILLYFALGALIITTLVIVVRTILFERGRGAVGAIEELPVDAQRVAANLAAAVRCATVPLDEGGAPDPEAFRCLARDAADNLSEGA